MTKPKIPNDLQMVLHHYDLSATCYQPVHLFVKNGRKLPNCAEPGDPWQVFLRRNSEFFGIISEGSGATLTDALEDALYKRTGQGLTTAMRTLGEQLDLLTEALHAR